MTIPPVAAADRPSGQAGTPAVSCAMCEIVSGRTPGHVVHEDELFLGVLDTMPAEQGHVLLITKEHANYLDELPAPVGRRLLATAGRIRDAILASPVPSERVLMFLSDGEPDYKSMPHVHMHIFPRNPAARASTSSGEPVARLDEVAGQLASAVARVQPQEARPESPGHRSLFWRSESEK